MQEHGTPKGTNVLDDLGLDPNYIIKAKLAIVIQKSITEMGLTQRQAAERLPMTQSKLSLLKRGKLDDISQSKLEECLRVLGHDIRITVGPRHERAGTVEVLEHA